MSSSCWFVVDRTCSSCFSRSVSSPVSSMFSHLVTPFITDRISGGSLFRHKVVSGHKLRLSFLSSYLPFSLPE
ncbi:hypothetical protein IGI04_031034, partial [Brassica rapa subsp. trilocularis]